MLVVAAACQNPSHWMTLRYRRQIAPMVLIRLATSIKSPSMSAFFANSCWLVQAYVAHYEPLESCLSKFGGVDTIRCVTFAVPKRAHNQTIHSLVVASQYRYLAITAASLALTDRGSHGSPKMTVAESESLAVAAKDYR